MTRGILYIVWDGETEAPKVLGRSLESVAKWHPDTPVEVVHLDPGSSLLDKARMLDVSPFDTTLFLDADTVVMGDLTFAFEKAEKFGLVCRICECPCARRYVGLRDYGDIIEYNTGVLCFTRAMQPLFDEWRRLAPLVDSKHYFFAKDGTYSVMLVNDQASFALAVHNTDTIPFCLPPNWNFRQTWDRRVFGPIKIWHEMSPVGDDYAKWNSQYDEPDAMIHCGEVKECR